MATGKISFPLVTTQSERLLSGDVMKSERHSFDRCFIEARCANATKIIHFMFWVEDQAKCLQKANVIRSSSSAVRCSVSFSKANEKKTKRKKKCSIWNVCKLKWIELVRVLITTITSEHDLKHRSMLFYETLVASRTTSKKKLVIKVVLAMWSPPILCVDKNSEKKSGRWVGDLLLHFLSAKWIVGFRIRWNAVVRKP